jgi:hypothetical protein
VIVTAQLKNGDLRFASDVHAHVGPTYVCWYDLDGEEQCVFFDEVETLGIISEAIIHVGNSKKKYESCYLQWLVFKGQEVAEDDFVIDGEVLTLEEVRERQLKPRHI